MDCEYTDPDDILIDSIIDGVQAKKLQEKLLDRGEELTLADAIKIGQQYEYDLYEMKMLLFQPYFRAQIENQRFLWAPNTSLCHNEVIP